MKNKITTELKMAPIVAQELMRELLVRGEDPELPLKTMPELNEKMWGIHKRKMLVIGARTSNGKSVMAINIAYDLSLQNKRVMFLSLEMPTARILERIFCLHASVDNKELMRNGYRKNPTIRKKYEEFMDGCPKNLILSDCIGKDWDYMDRLFSKMDRKPDAVFLDHIQEVRGGQAHKDRVDEHLSKMRESAIRNNFALIVCSQVNRVSQQEKEDKAPQLHQLKATGFLEEAADQVILLHWPWHYDNSQNKNEYIVNLAKNRDGMTGRIKMAIFPEHSKIRDFWKDDMGKILKAKFPGENQE